jgi:hypothetical protein
MQKNIQKNKKNPLHPNLTKLISIAKNEKFIKKAKKSKAKKEESWKEEKEDDNVAIPVNLEKIKEGVKQDIDEFGDGPPMWGYDPEPPRSRYQNTAYRAWNARTLLRRMARSEYNKRPFNRVNKEAGKIGGKKKKTRKKQKRKPKTKPKTKRKRRLKRKTRRRRT